MARRAVVAVGTALMVWAGTTALAPSTGAAPGPRFGSNYRLPTDMALRGRDVPGLAVDPADPNHIVEAEIDAVNLQCDYHVSFDGGRTWKGGHLTAASSQFPSPTCDPNFDAGGYAHFNTGIVFGSAQNVYITFSAHRGAFERLDTVPPTEGGFGDDTLVAPSTDGGRTFQPAVIAIPGGEPQPQPVSIRPQIAVQPGAGPGGKDRLYANAWRIRVTANPPLGGDRHMVVARSDDGGADWTKPVIASATKVRTAIEGAALGTEDETVRETSQPVVGPNGTVYAAYKNIDRLNGASCPPSTGATNCIVVARSTDLGATWTRKHTGVSLATSGAGQPRLAIDPTTPNGMGTLYVAYFQPGANGDPGDVFLQRSTDGGDTWTLPTRVNDDPSGSVQSFPQVSVRPGGRVDVIWFDRRHPYPGGGPRLGDIYYARSDDYGATFAANRRVTDRTFNRDVGLDAALGSYGFYGPFSLPLADGGALSAFMDSREGNLDSGVQDIYLSRLVGSGEMGRSTAATATAAGLSVVLSRLAYPGGPEAAGPQAGISRVVVVNEADVAGALAGAVLARANWAPLLLSPVGGMPAIVKADAVRMRPEGGFVVGDTSSLSSAVESELRQSTRSGAGVSRVAPASSVPAQDRPAEVARQVGELMKPLPGSAPEAVIVNPKTPEAASASGLAAALKLPILFVDERSTLPPPTSQAIASLGIKKVLIVGGPGVVNASVEASLTATLGAGNVKRLGGADQYDTSESVLTESRARGLPVNVVYVADGERPIDGALLGSAVGRVGGLLLLRPSADTGAGTEARLGALGVQAAVDRMAAMIGAGGVDPTLPSEPAPPAEAGGLTSTGIASASAGAAPDTLAPRVSGFRLTTNPFAVAAGPTPTFASAAATRRPRPRRPPHRRGTAFTYTLSEAATVRIAIARGRTGRRRGRRCVAPTGALRKAKKCVRLTAMGTLTRVSKAGPNTVAFSGRIATRPLPPGNYQATLTATDTANNTSEPTTITFKIIKG